MKELMEKFLATTDATEKNELVKKILEKYLRETFVVYGLGINLLERNDGIYFTYPEFYEQDTGYKEFEVESIRDNAIKTVKDMTRSSLLFMTFMNDLEDTDLIADAIDYFSNVDFNETEIKFYAKCRVGETWTKEDAEKIVKEVDALAAEQIRKILKKYEQQMEFEAV